MRRLHLPVQVWMCPHPPKRGVTWLGTCPKVHTGFYKAWTASGLHTEVIQYLQVIILTESRMQPCLAGYTHMHACAQASSSAATAHAHSSRKHGSRWQPAAS